MYFFFILITRFESPRSVWDPRRETPERKYSVTTGDNIRKVLKSSRNNHLHQYKKHHNQASKWQKQIKINANMAAKILPILVIVAGDQFVD